MKRMLVVDDDPATCLAIQSGLAKEYEITIDMGGESFSETVRHLQPHIILLDVNLPGLNGLKLLESIQSLLGEMLVFMITVRGGEEDILRAFKLGARDYVTKPFSLEVLKARIQRWVQDKSTRLNRVQIGSATADLEAGKVCTSQGTVALTRKEILVLQCFIANVGLVVPRDKLLDYAWGYDYEGTARTVDNVVTSLRQKLGFPNAETSPIQSLRGLGYRLEREALK